MNLNNCDLRTIGNKAYYAKENCNSKAECFGGIRDYFLILPTASKNVMFNSKNLRSFSVHDDGSWDAEPHLELGMTVNYVSSMYAK